MGDRVSERAVAMEVVHSPVSSDVIGKKRLWNMLRVAFLMMMRKGSVISNSKRKLKLLLMDINLMMMRSKLLRKTHLGGNLIFHHHHHHSHYSHPPPPSSGFDAGFQFCPQDYYYEFSSSCSNNSPNPPVSFHVAKHKHHYLSFPCINPPPPTVDDEESDDAAAHKDDDMAILVSPNSNNNYNKKKFLPDLSESPEEPNYPNNCSSFRFLDTATPPDLSPGDEPQLSPLLFSPFSVIRISNYSEEEEEEKDPNNTRVDDDAEQFITRFYEQLRVQNRTQLLQYQEEMHYQEMLARGTR